MSRQPKLCPKSQIPGFSEGLSDLGTVVPLSGFEASQAPAEAKRHHRIFRVKRKHVLKACDRCRVKKTKCDGNQPCNRCSAYNHPCLFRERKATQTKVYSKGFVEMLQSHHLLVVKGLQKLYQHCINKEGFPGEPLVEVADGQPLTHAILDRLGLIKQAEECPDDPEENLAEYLQYFRHLSTSTDCSDTVDPSSEPVSPSNPTPPNFEPSGSAAAANDGPWRWGSPSPPHEQYYTYPKYDYSEMMLRPEPVIVGSATEIQYHEPAPFVHSGQHNDDDIYGSRNNSIHETFRKGRVQTSSMMGWPGAYHGVAGHPVDMFGGYAFPIQEPQQQQQQQQQQAYPAPNNFARSNWTFPSV
ncbi:hypothetical protein VTN02DRAFT_5061 [Thermoascus thermophilus]